MNEAELVLTDLLNCDRVSLYLNKHKYLDKGQGEVFADIFKRRIRREPLQYILGKADFMGLVFKVNKDVLIPRPETEIVVETAIELGLRVKGQGLSLETLELGTGSGCIAISLAKFVKDIKITATDISQGALKVARENAVLNNVEINFLQGDLFNTYPLTLTAYPLIISNPPYIPSEEIDKLQAEVQSEPRVALDGGSDGLDFYRRLAQESSTYLKAGGFLIMEMGFNQAADIKNIFKNSGIFEIIDVIKDYNNIERVLIVKKVIPMKTGI